jgi:hypothetical protein
MGKLSLATTILGRPLATEEEEQQRLGAAAGIPVFGLDALSSAAYGQEAALTMGSSISAIVKRSPRIPPAAARIPSRAKT